MRLNTHLLSKVALALVAANLFALIWLVITRDKPPAPAGHEALPEGVVQLRKVGETAEKAEVELAPSPPAREELKAGMGVDAREQTAEERLEQLIREQAMAIETVKACYEIGPLTQQKDVDALSAGLQEIGITAKSRVVPPTDFQGYWVFLPPEKTFSFARLKLEELKRKGATDVLIVRKHGPANAISLGMFKNKDIAERRRAQIAELGYEPQIQMRYGDAQKTYLGIEVDSNRFLSPDRWAKILSRYTHAELIPLECARPIK